MRSIAIVFGLLLALLPTLALAQDTDDNPEVRGTAVVGSEEPVISEPVISVDDPGSKLPDWLTELTSLQTWHLLAATIASGLTAVALRWVPMPRSTKKKEDVRKLVAFSCAAVVAIVGAGLNGTLDLDGWVPSATGIVYVVGLAWGFYEKVPGVRNVLATKVEGRSRVATSG